MDLLTENLHTLLDLMNDDDLDRLSFGVIGLDSNGLTCRYSNYEATMAGLDPSEVIGRHFFGEIARCMNNGMVAKRFEDALGKGRMLDATIDYVLAFRTKITPVKLRILSKPESPVRYLIVQRLSGEVDAC